MLIFQGDKKNTGLISTDYPYSEISVAVSTEWRTGHFTVLSTNDCLAGVFMNNYYYRVVIIMFANDNINVHNTFIIMNNHYCRVVIWKLEKSLMKNKVANILLIEIHPRNSDFKVYLYV